MRTRSLGFQGSSALGEDRITGVNCVCFHDSSNYESFIAELPEHLFIGPVQRCRTLFAQILKEQTRVIAEPADLRFLRVSYERIASLLQLLILE